VVADDLKEARGSGRDLLADVHTDEAGAGVVERQGPEYDRQAVERASGRIREDLLPGKSADDLLAFSADGRKAGPDLESQVASRLHAVVANLEVAILQDEDFWRYLALFPFRWYLLAREPELKPQDFGGLRPHIRDGEVVSFRGTDMKKQLLLRTYLWGKCSFDANDQAGKPGNTYRRATYISEDGPSVIDVWHSHIIRPQIGHLGEIPRAFVDVSEDEPLTTDEARELAKLLTRMKHTVLLDSLEYGGAKDVIEDRIPLAREKVEEKKSRPS
jgi:hypothetical protein